MLVRLKDLARQRVNFAFETTLASRTFAPWLRQLIAGGYSFRLVFLWLPSPDVAVARVAERVKIGGHTVPEETIRRRYTKGLRNFIMLYRPLAESWQAYDSSHTSSPMLIAAGDQASVQVSNVALWNSVERDHDALDRR